MSMRTTNPTQLRFFVSRSPGDTSKGVEDLLPGNALVCGNNAQNAVEGSDPQRPMVWHRDTLMSGLFGLENDVAT